MRASGSLSVALLATISFGVVLAVTSTSAAEDAGGSALVVRVTGLRSDSGRVWVHLWNRPRGYPRRPDTAMRKASGRISGGASTVTFKGVAPGTYAAFAHHDEDGDGRIKTNFIGIPKEGMGASNNARGVMGPPSFKAASFEVSGARTAIGITCRYL